MQSGNDISDFGSLVVALTAVVGAFLAIRQLRIQARASTLNVLTEVNANWRARKALALPHMAQAATLLASAAVREQLARMFAVTGQAPRMTIPDDATDAVPFGLYALLPAPTPDQLAFTPRTEAQYVAMLRKRCDAAFPIFDQLSRRGGSPETNEAFRQLTLMAERYVNDVNDIAEIVEFKVMNPIAFLRKRHYAILREVYVLEPYVLWRASQPGAGRWGMRVLALGAASRAYHWNDSYHRTKHVLVLSVRERGALGSPYSTDWANDVLIGEARSNRFALRLRQTRAVRLCLSAGYRTWQNHLLDEFISAREVAND